VVGAAETTVGHLREQRGRHLEERRAGAQVGGDLRRVAEVLELVQGAAAERVLAVQQLLGLEIEDGAAGEPVGEQTDEGLLVQPGPTCEP